MECKHHYWRSNEKCRFFRQDLEDCINLAGRFLRYSKLTMDCILHQSSSSKVSMYAEYDLHLHHQTTRIQMAKFRLHGRNWKLLYTNYCAHTGLGQMHTFCIGKSIQWTNYVTQNDNWYKTFSVKHTCFILSIGFMKSNCIHWHKSIKHVSSVTKGFLGYLFWNSTTSKRVPHLYT